MKRKRPADPPRVRALVVERDPAKASLLCAFLLYQCFDHVATASTCHAALQFAQYLRPNLLIITDGLHEVHCLELYEQFQKLEGYSGLPTLVLSNQSADVNVHSRAKILDTQLNLNTLLTTMQQLLAASLASPPSVAGCTRGEDWSAPLR